MIAEKEIGPSLLASPDAPNCRQPVTLAQGVIHVRQLKAPFETVALANEELIMNGRAGRRRDRLVAPAAHVGRRNSGLGRAEYRAGAGVQFETRPARMNQEWIRDVQPKRADFPRQPEGEKQRNHGVAEQIPRRATRRLSR